MMNRFARSTFLGCFLLAAVLPCRAGQQSAAYRLDRTVLESEFPFDKAAHEIQLSGGMFYGLTENSAKRPHINLVLGSLRHGWMLGNPRGSGFFRGNLELLADLYGGGVIYGPSGGLVGASALLRYNFLQQDASLIPYFQFGGGGLYNTIYENTVQRELGSAFEFNLEVSVGARYMFNKHWAMFLETGYRHISNAGIGSRNLGLNTVGGFLGVNYFY